MTEAAAFEVVVGGGIRVGNRCDLVMAVARARALRLRGYAVWIRRRFSMGAQVVEVSADLRALSRESPDSRDGIAPWTAQVQQILDNIEE